VLVDPLRDYGGSGWRAGQWCHLATDASFAELHALAEAIGLRRSAFQGDHYDLRAPARAAAVRLGAEEVSSRELVGRMLTDRARRRALRRARAAAPYDAPAPWR